MLSRGDKFSPIISLITTIINSNPPNAQSLPAEIPIELAPQVITFAVHAGATQQSLQLWDLARQQIGDPQTPASLAQAHFFGDPGMTYALVRHYVKLAEKKSNRLQKWHTALLKGDSQHFPKTAEQVYEAFATADHYHISTSVACLFTLNRFTLAIDAPETLFRRREISDDEDFGIILAAPARRHPGRACQILLETAPARRKDEALRVILHARDAGCGSLEPKSLDVILRSALRDIGSSWKAGGGQEATDPIRIEQSHLFKRVIEVVNVA
ncbi:hypothetical protein FRC08_014901 [Ceratobasidium sp. 394]|nr:hypothetical protein FRC08_014901 [Ceratobasidium sp. 394]